MLWTILSIIGAVTGVIGTVVIGALLDRTWGRGHLGARRTVDYQVSEVEVLSRPPGVGG